MYSRYENKSLTRRRRRPPGENEDDESDAVDH